VSTDDDDRLPPLGVAVNGEDQSGFAWIPFACIDGVPTPILPGVSASNGGALPDRERRAQRWPTTAAPYVSS
jgi:hypothetical protein